MNKQIKQLAEQAWDYADYYGMLSDSKEHEIFTEKFAELIVQECADLFVNQRYMVLNPHEPFANELVRALKEHDKDTVRKIKQHFGVEA